MLRVGLTGGVACGKSTVGTMLAERGAHFLRADTLAHQLYEPGAPAYDAVVRAFGREILNPDGTVKRAARANRAFPDRIGELTAVVHPAVIEAQNTWMREVEAADPNGMAVVEAALLIEAGARKDFDQMIVVWFWLLASISGLVSMHSVKQVSLPLELIPLLLGQLHDRPRMAADGIVHGVKT